MRLGTMKRLMAQWVLHACKEVEEKTSITTRAWRHLSWTFEEAPMLVERAAREHLNGTLFEEETELAEDEPTKETELVSHDEDDAAEDEAHEVHHEEDVVPEQHGHSCCKGSRAVLHGGCRSRTRRTLSVLARRVRPASTKTMNCFQAVAGPKVRQHRAVDAMLRPGQASLQPPRSWE